MKTKAERGVNCVEIPLEGKQTFYGQHGIVLDLFFAGIGAVPVCAGVFFPGRRKEDEQEYTRYLKKKD